MRYLSHSLWNAVKEAIEATACLARYANSPATPQRGKPLPHEDLLAYVHFLADRIPPHRWVLARFDLVEPCKAPGNA